MTALEVQNLTVRLGTRTVLRDVSATAKEGEITVAVGPNAAGKSTLLRACSGLLAPQRGAVQFRGASVHRFRARARARAIAYVPQRPIVSAGYTVREVIAMGRYALPQVEHRITEAMEQLELTDLSRVSFHELSVGQQQRVSLARALAQHERGGTIILDEPTSAMDMRHARAARLVLRDIASGLPGAQKGAGATVIMAMHEIATAAEFGDHVWLLDNGRLVGKGAPAEILSPERLHEVFGVRYERITRQGGASTLVPAD